MTTRPHLTIDLAALGANWQKLKQLSGKAECSAVVKADAYGLHIEPVVKTLLNEGCKTFFVAMAEEGERVRALSRDARIFLLNGVVPETVDLVKSNNLIPILSCPSHVEYWSQVSDKHPCALHVDTGMNRLGMGLSQLSEISKNQALLTSINPLLLMSHLACADEPSDAMNQQQLDRFLKAKAVFPQIECSFANSAGIMLGGDYHFDLTRPGIAMYGGEAVNDVPNPMKPVATAKARILQIRTADKGEAIGYGAAHRFDKQTKIAVCSVGYADGYHRAGSGSGAPLRANTSSGGYGAIGNIHVPILGRVSMDLTTFDVSEVPEEVLVDTQFVELFGKHIPVDDAARNCGTIGYELLTSLGSRYHREYISGKS